MLQQYTDVDVKKASGAIHTICDASTIPNTGNISHKLIWHCVREVFWSKVSHISALDLESNFTVDEWIQFLISS